MFNVKIPKGKSRFEYAVADELLNVIHRSRSFFELAGTDETENLDQCLAAFGTSRTRLIKTEKPLRLDRPGDSLRCTVEPFSGGGVRLFFIALTDEKYVLALQKNIDLLAGQGYLIKSILDNLHDGIFIVDATGRIVYFNDAITRLAGYEKAAMIGSNVFEGLEQGEYKNSCVARVLETGRPQATINEYSQWGVKKGQVKGSDCLVSGTPIFDSRGKLKYAVSIARDISELQRIQDELQKTKTLSLIYNRQLKSFQERASLEVAQTRSKVMEDLHELAVQVADLDLPLLLVGETGVGKDFFAKYIHAIGIRSASPFLKINCSAIPDNLLESELFGYEGGAFTGAKKEGKQGLFVVSGEGSLFLDEVGDMPYHLQAKLLGVLQDKTIIPVGGKKEVRIKSRIIAATNADLDELIRQKKFRSDLFYRLNVIQFKIPPLRERKEDIIFFANEFLSNFNNKYNKNIRFSSGLYDRMLFYSWPGNIRELKNTVERLVIMSKDGFITENSVPGQKFLSAPPLAPTAAEGLPPDGVSLKEAVALYEAKLIAAAISSTGGTTEAASRLGIDVSTLIRKRRRSTQAAKNK